MTRVTTLKADKAGLAALIDYYAGLAADQLRRDGVSRGPVDYYLDPNEPPGRWWGSGCAAMELAGEVQPEQLAALLQARHPGYGGRLGRGFGAKSARGFDATFSAPKSASLLWALSPDPWVRAEVLAAHDTAVLAGLDWFEHHGAVTRRGKDGVDQVDTQGLVAALFRQHTSRTADPELHTHAVIAAKVQNPTGKWLSLDARFLKQQQRSISWVYASAVRSELSGRLGVSWGPVEEGHAEIHGVPGDLLKVFSQRSQQVEAKTPSWSLPGSTSTTAPSPTPGPSTSWNGGRCWPADRPSRTRSRPRRCARSGRSGPERLASNRCHYPMAIVRCREALPWTSTP